MKKIVALLVALCVVFAFGCTSPDPPPTPEDTQPLEVTTPPASEETQLLPEVSEYWEVELPMPDHVEPATDNPADDEADEEADDVLVWISEHGTKYHVDPNCSGMKEPRQVTVAEAESEGREPCAKCY